MKNLVQNDNVAICGNASSFLFPFFPFMTYVHLTRIQHVASARRET